MFFGTFKNVFNKRLKKIICKSKKKHLDKQILVVFKINFYILIL